MILVKRILRSNILKKLIKNNFIWTIGVVVLVFAVLAYSIRRDWYTILAFQWQLNWIYLVEMAIFHVLALGTMYLAWHFMMKRLTDHNQWGVNFRIFGISMLARRIPLPIWYLGSRVILYKEFDIPATVTLTASALEIALVALSGILCYVLLVPWYSYTQNIAWWAALIPACLLITIFLIRPRIFVDTINRVLERFKRPPIKTQIARGDLLLWISLYLVTWFLDGFGFYFAVTAFVKSPLPIASIIGISTVSALIGLLTMALPSGFGLKELAMGSLLSGWIPLSVGVVLSFMFRFLQSIIEAGWVFISQHIHIYSIENMKNNP